MEVVEITPSLHPRVPPTPPRYVRADLDPAADSAAHELRSMTERAWVLASKRLSEADTGLARVQAAHTGLTRQLDAQVEAGKDSARALDTEKQRAEQTAEDFRNAEHALHVEEAKVRAANAALDDMRRQFDDQQAAQARREGKAQAAAQARREEARAAKERAALQAWQEALAEEGRQERAAAAATTRRGAPRARRTKRSLRPCRPRPVT